MNIFVKLQAQPKAETKKKKARKSTGEELINPNVLKLIVLKGKLEEGCKFGWWICNYTFGTFFNTMYISPF